MNTNATNATKTRRDPSTVALAFPLKTLALFLLIGGLLLSADAQAPFGVVAGVGILSGTSAKGVATTVTFTENRQDALSSTKEFSVDSGDTERLITTVHRTHFCITAILSGTSLVSGTALITGSLPAENTIVACQVGGFFNSEVLTDASTKHFNSSETFPLSDGINFNPDGTPKTEGTITYNWATPGELRIVMSGVNVGSIVEDKPYSVAPSPPGGTIVSGTTVTTGSTSSSSPIVTSTTVVSSTTTTTSPPTSSTSLSSGPYGRFPYHNFTNAWVYVANTTGTAEGAGLVYYGGAVQNVARVLSYVTTGTTSSTPTGANGLFTLTSYAIASTKAIPPPLIENVSLTSTSGLQIQLADEYPELLSVQNVTVNGGSNLGVSMPMPTTTGTFVQFQTAPFGSALDGQVLTTGTATGDPTTLMPGSLLEIQFERFGNEPVTSLYEQP